MLSAVLITLNEAHSISKCLTSVQDIVDEIIVVDAESSDDTVKIAVAQGAKVFIKSWKGYGAARNYGDQVASNDWIFSIDADERLSSALGTSIKNERLQESSVYQVKRVNYYAGKRMKYGMLSPEWKSRIYHRLNANWSSREVHESLMIQSTTSHKRLNGFLLHYAYPNHETLVEKLDHYAKLSARAWRKEKFTPGKVQQLLGPYWHFIKSYILKLGFLEGYNGFRISVAAFCYSKKKYEYLKELG